MPLFNCCLFRLRVLKLFSLSADLATVLHVPSFSFKTCYTCDVCIRLDFKTSFSFCVPVLFFHWVFIVWVKKLYAWLSAQPFHSFLLSVQGGFGASFSGGDAFRDLPSGWCYLVQSYDRSPLKYLHLWMNFYPYNQIKTISYFTRSSYSLILPSVNKQLLKNIRPYIPAYIHLI